MRLAIRQAGGRNVMMQDVEWYGEVYGLTDVVEFKRDIMATELDPRAMNGIIRIPKGSFGVITDIMLLPDLQYTVQLSANRRFAVEPTWITKYKG